MPVTGEVTLSLSISLVAKSCLTLETAKEPARLLCPWGSLGKNTGVGSHFLLQGIFLTEESNWGFLHCRQILYQLSYEGIPRTLYYQMNYGFFFSHFFKLLLLSLLSPLNFSMWSSINGFLRRIYKHRCMLGVCVLSYTYTHTHVQVLGWKRTRNIFLAGKNCKKPKKILWNETNIGAYKISKIEA